MNTKKKATIPTWFCLFCYATPLVALLIATVGIAFGTAMNFMVFTVLSAMSWKIISNLLGIPASPLVSNVAKALLERHRANLP